MNAQQSVPDVRAYSMAEFYTSTYRVPQYQRNYTWGETEVGQLVDDLLEFGKSSEPFYLLGDVIAAHSEDAQYKFELVDGQQRTTTMALIFLVIYKRLIQLKFDAVDTNSILNSFLINRGLRINMSGRGSEFVLRYFNNESLQEIPKVTPSQLNIAEALEVISKRLTYAFDDSQGLELMRFSENLLQHVYFGRLTLGSVDQATSFFERVNNRGVRLTNADLLKNRVLQNIAKEEDYEAAASVWSRAEQALISRGKLGSVEFLLRQIRQADLGEKIKDTELFEKTKDLVKTESGCLQLVDRIESKYLVLANILDGVTPFGQEDSNAHGTRFFGFTQHFGIKLSGSHLNEVAYRHLSRRIEARSILALLAGERPSAFEKDVPVWQSAISKLESSVDDGQVDAALSFEEKRMVDLLKLSHTQFQTWRYDGTPGQVKRIRYILARANHIVNSQGPTINFTLQDFLTTSKNSKKTRVPGFDIDHVHPKSNSNAFFEVHSVGNLTLLHSQDNREKSDSEPGDARTIYGNSQSYLTKALTTFPTTNQVEKVISNYRVALADSEEAWGPRQVSARAEMYFDVVFRRLHEDLGISKNYSDIF